VSGGFRSADFRVFRVCRIADILVGRPLTNLYRVMEIQPLQAGNACGTADWKTCDTPQNTL
jgi:hypothetical protein